MFVVASSSFFDQGLRHSHMILYVIPVHHFTDDDVIQYYQPVLLTSEPTSLNLRPQDTQRCIVLTFFHTRQRKNVCYPLWIVPHRTITQKFTNHVSS